MQGRPRTTICVLRHVCCTFDRRCLLTDRQCVETCEADAKRGRICPAYPKASSTTSHSPSPTKQNQITATFEQRHGISCGTRTRSLRSSLHQGCLLLSRCLAYPPDAQLQASPLQDRVPGVPGYRAHTKGIVSLVLRAFCFMYLLPRSGFRH